jgi:hypothetical protein
LFRTVISLQRHALKADHSHSDLDEGFTGTLLYVIVLVEVILMLALLIIASMFLCQSCRAKQKAAPFIVKLLILVVLVASAGIFDALHDAPWWSKESAYYDSIYDIIITGIAEFIYWTAA